MAKLIFGCGYLGSRVARLWRAGGHEVLVVTRSAERSAELSAAGFRPIVADVLRPDSLRGLPAAETVLYAVGYDRGCGASLGEVYIGGLQAVLAALPPETGKLMYISSSGVYGQSRGEMVDEQSPTEPAREGGRACLAAEQALAAHRLGRRAIVLRMAGIYGPGRVPRRADVRAGVPIAAAPDAWLNLIHVDDAAAVVLAAEARAVPPRSYVVSDGSPTPRRAYYEELARLWGGPPPRFKPAAGDARGARRGSGKRVSNARMVAELAVPLAYPDFRAGLAAIVSQPDETSA